MKAFSCFVVICGVLVSTDLAFGYSFGVRKLESEDKSDGKVAPAEETNPEVLKKVEGRLAEMKEALIRDINNRESEETALIQTLRNSTSKQLKIVDGKVIITEEKVVSLGTKDNATIAVYKLITVRPFIVPAESESEQSNSDSNQPSEQAADSSDKSSDEPQVQPDTSDPETSNSETSDSESAQPAENPSSPSTSAQNDLSVQQDQPAQNDSAPRVPVIKMKGPDGVVRPVHGIAIKLSPKNDGTDGKNIAFQFFKK